MIQQVCIHAADLRIELGRLRHERHEIEHQLQALEQELNLLRAQKQVNRQQMKRLEKHLADISDSTHGEDCVSGLETGGTIEASINRDRQFNIWLLAILLLPILMILVGNLS